MAIQLTFSNMLQLTSTLSPILITFFLVMLSLFNLNMKGIVYLAGVLLASVINYMLMPLFSTSKDGINVPPAMCNLIELPFWTQYTSPSPSSLYLSFTLIYLFLPMFYNNQINTYLLTTLILLIGIDLITKIKNNCTDTMGAFVGLIFGVFLGTLWYTLLTVNNLEKLLYFDEFDSNRPQCSVPSKQKFKCRNTRSGEIITTVDNL